MRNKVYFNINSIPKEWLIIPSGRFFKEKSIKNTKNEINLSVYRDYGVIPKDSRDDNHNKVSEDTSNYKLVEPGNFVLNKMKGWSGSLGVSDYRGIVSPSYTVLEPVKKIHNKYFHYLLRSEPYRQMYESLSYGVRIGQWELRYHDFKQIPSLYPPIEEQKIIARYLDNKIKQINKLIEKIQRKIELLNELRFSIIKKYVTHGLDRDVKMKKTGIKWVGSIPENWVISRFKYFFDFGMGETILKEQLTDTGYPVLSATENYNILGFYNSPSLLLNEGDIVIPARGTIGFVKIVRETSVSTQTTIYGKKKQKINTKFFSYFCEGNKPYLFQFEKTAIPQITVEQVQNNIILIPPLNEQEKIITELDQKCLLFEKLIVKLNKRLSLLKEYRISLISSVVTGKVRISEDKI